MKGTEKQIAWATDLIETMECRFREALAECKRVQPSEYGQTNLFSELSKQCLMKHMQVMLLLC